ncbi:MAG: hypothetical protein IPG21_13505 [Saprospiraceae bacterium]|nr:hypothetical protein [Candidatus Vicinibacter affinis]
MHKTFLLFCFFIVLAATNLMAQSKYKIIEGVISYKNANNIYVKFYSTQELNIGDTLYLKNDSTNAPAFKIQHKSSISCVCNQIGNFDITTGLKVYAKILQKEIQSNPVQHLDSLNKNNEVQDLEILANVQDSINLVKQNEKRSARKELINGRFSFSTNGDLDNPEQSRFTRIRISNSFNISHINSSKFSFQSYLTYRHRFGIDQNEVGFFDDFKVYTLAAGYEINSKSNIWFGRKINSNIANMGALDGVQYEHTIGKLVAGVLAGTRPDVFNYGFNGKLAQAGLYLVQNTDTKNGLTQTSLAFVEQHFAGKVDRRFTYFQHSNNLIRNLNLFLSVELDLYQRIQENSKQTLRLTSFYSNLRYRINRRISIQASYDNRRNVIYYESFRNIVDQLLAQETRQGLRFQINYAPIRFVSINASTFLRFQGINATPTTNHMLNLNFANIPGTKISASLSANYLETEYIKGTTLSGRAYRDFFKSKLTVELNYRQSNYTYVGSEQTIQQDIAGLSLSYQISRLSSILLNFESGFGDGSEYNRYFVTYLQRFKNKKKSNNK